MRRRDRLIVAVFYTTPKLLLGAVMIATAAAYASALAIEASMRNEANES